MKAMTHKYRKFYHVYTTPDILIKICYSLLHSIWYGDHNWPSYCLCHDWDVWHAIGAWYGGVSTDCTAAGDSWTNSVTTR